MTWNEYCDAYLKGNVTETEFRWYIFTVLDEGNIGDFMANAPATCIHMLRDSLEKHPKTDQEWSKMAVFGLEYNPTDTPLVLEACRRGVEAVREALINPYCGGCGHNFFYEAKITKEEAKKRAKTRRCHYCIEEMQEQS